MQPTLATHGPRRLWAHSHWKLSSGPSSRPPHWNTSLVSLQTFTEHTKWWALLLLQSLACHLALLHTKTHLALPFCLERGGVFLQLVKVTGSPPAHSHCPRLSLSFRPWTMRGKLGFLLQLNMIEVTLNYFIKQDLWNLLIKYKNFFNAPCHAGCWYCNPLINASRHLSIKIIWSWTNLENPLQAIIVLHSVLTKYIGSLLRHLPEHDSQTVAQCS